MFIVNSTDTYSTCSLHRGVLLATVLHAPGVDECTSFLKIDLLSYRFIVQVCNFVRVGVQEYISALSVICLSVLSSPFTLLHACYLAVSVCSAHVFPDAPFLVRQTVVYPNFSCNSLPVIIPLRLSQSTICFSHFVSSTRSSKLSPSMFQVCH